MKLHLGCGKRFLEGFIHVDIANFPHIDHYASVENLSFLGDGVVDEIYSSHTLEYFDRSVVKNVLTEWLRVLKPGGKLYLTVPDFDSLISIYRKTGSLEKIIGPLFGRWENPGITVPIFHKTTWNHEDLVSVFNEVGFSGIESFDPVTYLSNIDSKYDDYSLAFFPHLDRNGIQVSLALCGIKT